MLDFYQILGVSFEATQEEIKHAYRIQIRKYHPDLNPDINTHQKMVNINLAYETLSNPEKRKIYDINFKHNNNIHKQNINTKNNSKKSKKINYDEWLKSYLMKRHSLDKLYSNYAKIIQYREYFDLNEIKILISEYMILLIDTEIEKPLNLLRFIFDSFKTTLLKLGTTSNSYIDNENEVIISLLLIELDFTLHKIFKKYNPFTIEYHNVRTYIVQEYFDVLALRMILENSYLEKYLDEIEKTLLQVINNNLSYFDDFDAFSRYGR